MAVVKLGIGAIIDYNEKKYKIKGYASVDEILVKQIESQLVQFHDQFVLSRALRPQERERLPPAAHVVAESTAFDSRPAWAQSRFLEKGALLTFSNHTYV